MTLLSGAGLLLLIACVNTASLVLVRSESRNREIAVRISLGASSFRLISQFLVEAMVLVFGAAALGLLLAHWGIRLLTGLIPKSMMINMPYLQELSLNSRVLLFAAAVAGLAVIVLSAAPSLFLLASKSREGLARGERGSAGNTWRKVGANLVVVELAVAMVLLVGAGLLGRSFQKLLQVELGFQPDHLATIQVILPPNTYKTNELTARTARTIGDTIAALPGVEAVGVTTILPVGFNGNTTWIRIAGKPYNGEHNETNERDVSTGYFQAIGARLVRGRFFTEADNPTRPNVVIINRTLARRYFGDEDPIGKQIGDTSLSPKSMTEVVGVVEDIRDGALDTEIWPAVYHPFEQDPSFSFALMVRSTQSEKALFPAILSKIRSLDPSIGTMGEATMSGLIDDSPPAYLHRSSAWLVAVFAGLALLLGVVGFYGVTAYSVGQRTREIGIRMALGAQRGSVYSLVLREASRLIALGILLGVFCSIAAARLAENMLFGVGSWDFPTLAAVAVMLALSALLASFVPARRAASLNPVRALNTE